MPATYNLVIYRGDTASWRFQIWTDASKSTPVNLAGSTAKAELRNKPSGGTIVPTTCAIVPPNTINMTLTATNSKNVVSGVWDLQITDATGVVSTMVAGTVTVTPDVTDST